MRVKVRQKPLQLAQRQRASVPQTAGERLAAGDELEKAFAEQPLDFELISEGTLTGKLVNFSKKRYQLLCQRHAGERSVALKGTDQPERDGALWRTIQKGRMDNQGQKPGCLSTAGSGCVGNAGINQNSLAGRKQVFPLA